MDKILESSSVSNALMTTEYNMSLSTPLKPANPPSEPASELSKLACSIVSNPSCAPAAKAATPKILGGEREKFDDKRGTLLPFNPANANCTPSSLAVVSEISTIMASTKTWGRRTSNLLIICSKATCVSPEALITSVLLSAS